MLCLRRRKKRAPYGALFVILLFSSCGTSKSCPEWQRTCATSLCPYYKAIKRTYTTNEICRNLQLEVITTDDETAVYLNAFSTPFSSSPENPAKTLLTLTINGSEVDTSADKLLGSQRLRFSERDAALIVNALNSCQPIQIQTDWYDATFPPNGWGG